MDELFVFVPIIVFGVIVFAVKYLANILKNAFYENTPNKPAVQDAKYNRQVHQMHTKDAASERRHRLDQLKSLYEAGMMEKDEYYERVEAVEADYRGR